MLGDSWPDHSGNWLEASVSQGGDWGTVRMEQQHWSWLFSHLVSKTVASLKGFKIPPSPSTGSTLMLWTITPCAQPFQEQHRVLDVHIGELPLLVSVLNSILWLQQQGSLSVHQIQLQTHLWMLCLCAVESWAQITLKAKEMTLWSLTTHLSPPAEVCAQNTTGAVSLP